ncbi:MAG: efflux RND transporter periplasmic adaptor subunit [Deltaproteobacteria bacterium]|nr:efflux RND transporter periplasmic adaptor subunit [Deltaproteobacteria bacterium]
MKKSLALPRQVWVGLFGIVFLLVFGWIAAKSGPFAPIKVTVTQVAKGEVRPALSGIGTVEAQRAYLIGPTAAGRVKRVLVDVGDAVKVGQLLAEMEPVDLDERVASAVAAATRARSAVLTVEAQLHDVKSRQELAAIEAQRYIEMGHKGFVSQSIVDGMVQQQKSADAQLSAAEAALVGARKDLSKLESELEGAKRQRMNIRMEAPADGVVTSRDAEPGSTVVAGQAVLKLVQPTSLWVTVRLDQGRSSGLRAGLPAGITLRSNPQKPLAGKVVRVEPSSDSVTEERIAQVAFDLMPQGVSTGEMAEVTLRLPTLSDALIIPNASLRYRGAQVGVWLRADGHLRFAKVKTGEESLDGKVQILEGLKSGDEVIVFSERDLKDDSRIKVVDSLVRKAQ